MSPPESDSPASDAPLRTGGCQCGAVRFRVQAPNRRPSICHCRMCQKATGSPFGAYATFPTAAIEWTRGQRKLFQSSNDIARGFCGDCGTPLTFEPVAGASHISLTICAFDDPATLAPELQLDVAARVPWFDGIAALTARTPGEEIASAARYAPVISRQHPDYDTDVWPPAP